MNEYLWPIFNIVIPAIEEAGISYWVYGGVAIAGIKGYFYRSNQDVDIFVLNKDYEKVVEIIKSLAKENSWNQPKQSVLKEIRPKLELFINGTERLSLVPVYEEKNEVKFYFGNSIKFSKELLEPVTNFIGTFKIIRPNEDLLKKLLSFYLETFFKSERRKGNKNLWEKRKLDTKQLLGNEEAERLFKKEEEIINNE